MKTLLLVEDDQDLCRGIAFALEKDGYEVICADTIFGGQELLARSFADLVILDVGLPDGDGIEFCKEIRRTSAIPIIILTARDMETDEVSGLLSGADDYITKPFSLSVLRARVEALLRRTQAIDNPMIKSGRYRLDTTTCKFYAGAEEIPISVTELKLLKYLMSNAGQILTKEQILAALWDNKGHFVDDNTLPVNISRLRAKMKEDSKNPTVLKTIHGLGYVWMKEQA